MTDGFAIIGISARLPRANGPAAFWRLLSSGTDAVTDPPPGRTTTRRGAFLDDITGFDAAFFGLFPREAAATGRSASARPQNCAAAQCFFRWTAR